VLLARHLLLRTSEKILPRTTVNSAPAPVFSYVEIPRCVRKKTKHKKARPARGSGPGESLLPRTSQNSSSTHYGE
jgi:hypothetical protein